MDQWFFYISAVLIPIGIFAGNLALRWKGNAPLSSGADAFLLYIGFDATVLANTKDVEPLLVAGLRGHEQLIYLGMLVWAFVIWIYIVVHAEGKILSSFDPESRKHIETFPAKAFVVSWSFVGAFLVAHVLTFI